jgi:threonine dehydratase
MGVTVEGIIKAEQRLKDVVKHTDLQLNANLSAKYDCNIYLKREDLQIVRSYKLRGAYNAIDSLKKDQLTKGVVCASAGNHAQGVAYACQEKKIKGWIFMPSTTPKQKVKQVEMFGKAYVEIILTGDTFDDAYAEAKQFCEQEEKTFIHPFDNQKVIEGQGTVGVEIFKDFVGEIDYLLAPIGGGGLISGIATYFKKVSPDTHLIGVEPEGAASMTAALREGKVVKLTEIDKFVDGAAVQQVGQLPFEICEKLIKQTVTVPEGKVCSTIIQLYNEEAIVAEPAGALTTAALDNVKDKIKGKNIVCIISGSNNDLGRMEEIKERSLLYEGLKHYFMIHFPQRSGALREFLDEVLGPDDDITHFEYTKKSLRESGPAIVGVELKNKEDYPKLVDRLKAKKIKYKSINEDPTLFEYFI